MPRFRVVLSLLAAAALVAGVSVHAQFGNILKKVPKPPSVPGAAKPAPPPAERQAYCAGITDEKIDQYLKAKEARDETLKKEIADANAKKAQADALAQKRAQAMVDVMMKTSECTDAFKEKDPRSKEISRLEGLAEAATNSGNDAKAEELQRKASQLSDALTVDADRACGGRGASALHDCMASKKVTLAKQGVSEPMLTVQAQGECMQDPATSGTPGMTAPTAAEEAASAGAAEAMRNAYSNADKAGADAAGMTQDEFGRLGECIVGVLSGNESTPATDDSKAAIKNRSSELKSATKDQ